MSLSREKKSGFGDVQNGIAVELISKPLQQIVVQTEEHSTKNVNGRTRKKIFFNAIDLLSVLELEHTMSDIVSSECTNVDQVIVESLVENCNKILLDAQKYHALFNVSEYSVILRIAKFCKIILALFKEY